MPHTSHPSTLSFHGPHYPTNSTARRFKDRRQLETIHPMQPLSRRRCALIFVLDVFAISLLCVLSCLVVYQHVRHGKASSYSFLRPDDISPALPSQSASPSRRPGGKGASEVVKLRKSTRSDTVGRTQTTTKNVVINSERCTMGACFNVQRCNQLPEFRVYVYPRDENLNVSPLFEKILRVIKSSRYYTTNPEEACLFVPSYDTLDRDKHSKDYLKNMPKLSSLPYWNGGENHLIFNQYAGTWPDYQEKLDFDYGKAIIAKSSFNISHFRPGFDVSLPLMHKEHPEREGEPGVLSTHGNLLPVKRKYLLAFKGKRYLYGRGRETRSSVYHLHNGKDIIMLTTCKHNRDWLKYQDERCKEDNKLYDEYDYSDLLTNASFCLVPRGRRLGSFRFLESLQASCVPVSLSSGYIIPFHEVIDWSLVSLDIDERQLLQVPHMVRSIPANQLLSMRLQTQFVWDTYLNSVEKIIMTTVEIIHSRLRPKGLYVWNHPPGGLHVHSQFSPSPTDYPFFRDYPKLTHQQGDGEGEGEGGGVAPLTAVNYTAIITCTKPVLRESSPLFRLVKALSTAAHLQRIIIVWMGSGSPHIKLPKVAPLPVSIVTLDGTSNKLTKQFWPTADIETDAVLHLNEDVEMISDEAEFGFATWQSFSDRLVGFVAHKHYWDSVRLQWSYTSDWSNDYSLVLTGALFYHRYYGYMLSNSLPPQVQSLANQNPNCLDIVFNFMVAHVTHQPPVKVTQKRALTRARVDSTSIQQKQNQDRIACFNMVTNAYGYVPLVYSSVRMDPILFKDNVSNFRKEYRKLEVLYT